MADSEKINTQDTKARILVVEDIRSVPGIFRSYTDGAISTTYRPIFFKLAVSDLEEGDGWRALAARIDQGSTAIFLSPHAFQRGDDPLAVVGLANAPLKSNLTNEPPLS